MSFSQAAATYGANVRETREHFAALIDQAYERWLSSDMSIVTRDRMMARIRAREARYVALEGDLYRLNLAREA